MKNNIQNNDFTKGNISAIMVKTAFPSIIAQVVSLLYSIVDRVYIGHLPNFSSDALSGLGLCLPLVLLINAFANMIGLGGAPLCSIARGKGDLETGERIIGNSFTLLILFGTVVTITFFFASDTILMLFGASEDTFPFASDYMRIYSLGSLFAMLSLGMNAFINAQGFTKMGMRTTLIGAVLNAILDPIFIFVLDLGIKGAAIATVIAQACSAVWVISFLCGDTAILKLRTSLMPLDPLTVGSVLKMGLSPFITNATSSLVQTLENMQLYRYGGDVFVCAMTVISSINQIFLTAAQGFAAGVQPVLSFNYGAGRGDRLKTGICFETAIISAYMLLCTILLLIAPEPLIRIFNSEEAILQHIIPCTRVFFVGFVFMSFQLVGNSVLQAFGQAKKAIFFSFLRKVFIVTPLIFILPELFGMGSMGIFYAETISCIIGGPCCFLTMYLTQYRNLDRLGS